MYNLEDFLPAVLVSVIFKTSLIETHLMKLGVQNYAVTLTTENSCIRFNNNKIYSLHRILIKVIYRYPNTNSKFQTTAIFESSFNENKDTRLISTLIVVILFEAMGKLFVYPISKYKYSSLLCF
jgi:hypothetical protein